MIEMKNYWKTMAKGYFYMARGKMRIRYELLQDTKERTGFGLPDLKLKLAEMC